VTQRLRPFLTVIVVAGAGLLSTTAPATAQDSHYWTLQYGPRSSLLGGAVIGSVDDVSATFYNPGALSLASDLAFAVSADVFEVTGVILEGGGGEGVDLGNSKSGLRPSLIAGTLKRGLLGGGGVLAYSALTRGRGTQDLAGAALLSGEDLRPELDLQDAVGGVAFTGRFDDFWGGLTYSQALGEHFGLGVTWYGAVRSQERRREAIGQLINTDGSGSSEIDISGGSYTAYRTLFKLGGSFATGPITGGLTLTTPSIQLGGSGDLSFNQSAFGTDTVALAASVQPDLSATYKSPLSVGAGLAWRIGGARLHGSLEWFDAIAPYFVMQGEDVPAQEPPDRIIPVDAVQEQDEVLNWALGLEYAFTPKVSAYLSYYTDNSTLTDEVERAGLGVLPFNISNVNLGTDFVVKSARLMLGFGFGWGSKVDQNLTDLLRERDPDFVATYVFRSMKLLFGFEIGVG
jgi:hypothetical protein